MVPYIRDAGPLHGHLPRSERPVQARTPEFLAPDDVPGWQLLGACGSEDPELFFPLGNTGPAQLQVEDAKAVCRRCMVADQCLRWALESGQDAGVWGGMSEEERRSLKRREARQRQAAANGGES